MLDNFKLVIKKSGILFTLLFKKQCRFFIIQTKQRHGRISFPFLGNTVLAWKY